MWIFQFFSNFLKLKSVTASKLLQNNKRITSSCLNNHKITKSTSSTKRRCLKNEAFADIWWYRVKSRPWTKFKQSNCIVSWFHNVVKHAIALARIETCWCWWWRWLFFSEQFLISYALYGDPNHHLLIRQAGVQYLSNNPERFIESNTRLRIHGMHI